MTETISTDAYLSPLIVTLRMDETALAHFTALRTRYFPPERNFLTAHITLFHKLPGDQITRIVDDMDHVAAKTQAFTMKTDGLLFFGAGVAYRINAPQAVTLRHNLFECWSDITAPQDAKPDFTPHITIQNKVKADEAKALYAQLTETFTPIPLIATGLDLWHYQGGPWDHAAGFSFSNI